MRTQHGEHLEQAGLHQVLPAEEGAFQARLHERELGAVLVEETAEAGSVIRRKRGNLPLHRRYVRRAVEFAARSELIRIAGPAAPFRPRHAGSFRRRGIFLPTLVGKEKGRAEIKLVAVGLKSGGASTNDRQTFYNFYFEALRRQQYGGSQSARPGTDDESLFTHGC